jgi:hypothetical protein
MTANELENADAAPDRLLRQVEAIRGKTLALVPPARQPDGMMAALV